MIIIKGEFPKKMFSTEDRYAASLIIEHGKVIKNRFGEQEISVSEPIITENEKEIIIKFRKEKYNA